MTAPSFTPAQTLQSALSHRFHQTAPDSQFHPQTPARPQSSDTPDIHPMDNRKTAGSPGVLRTRNPEFAGSLSVIVPPKTD